METKEERQRLILGGVLIVGALYCYFGLLISPMAMGTARAERAIQDRQQQIASIGAELRTLREEVAKLDHPILDAAAKELLETVPKSHLVSTPSILSRLLDQHTLPKRRTRASMLTPFEGREDLRCARWEVKVWEAGALQVGQAIAAMENEFRLGQMKEVSIERNTATGTVDATVTLQIVIPP